MHYGFFYFIEEKDYPTLRLASQKGDLVSYLVSFHGIFVCEFGHRHSSQRFYPRVPLSLSIFYKAGRVFVKKLNPLGYFFLGSAIHPF